jgi:hypothetical protein
LKSWHTIGTQNGGEIMKLGGEYDHDGMSEEIARWLFLNALEETCPAVLDELNGLTPGDQVQLDSWAEKHNLTELWIKNAAAHNLRYWHQFPELADTPLKWVYYPAASYWQPLSSDDRKLSFTHGGWDPISETWPAFKNRVKADLECYLESHYKKVVEGAADGKGLSETPTVRQVKHFKWLVHKKVERKQYKDIADLYKLPGGDVLSEDMIAKGARKAAKLSGISI